jgi:adenylyltransferase/sulfurtransferase
MDPDSVELHNLHRQVIHFEAFVGELKVKSAATTCLAINSSLHVSNQSLQNLAILESCN